MSTPTNINPRLDLVRGRVEVHTGGESITVCCGANETIEIQKMYGPLVADDIRIRLHFEDNGACDWVVERSSDDENGGVWEEMARFPCDKGGDVP